MFIDAALLSRPPHRGRAALLRVRCACAALLLAAALCTAHVAAAGEATLSWSAPDTHTDGSPLTDLAGFRLYVGTASGSYDSSVDVGPHTNYLLPDLIPGSTYYFAVTAYDTTGTESVFSNEVSFSLPPLAGSASYSVADALLALREATGMAGSTSADTARLDVAPLNGDGKPQGNGVVDVADAVIILKNAVGLLSW